MSIDLLDLVTTFPPFAAEAGVVVPPDGEGVLALAGDLAFDAGIFDQPPPYVAPHGPGLTASFPAETFPNEIILYAYMESVDDAGAPVVDPWPESGRASVASVQASLPSMMDPMGRLVVTTSYMVKTPTDIAARERDKIAWGTRTLIAQGPTIDAGGLGVIYETACTETGPDG